MLRGKTSSGDLAFYDDDTGAAVVTIRDGTGGLALGTSGTPLSFTEGTPVFDLYTTCASTDGAVSAQPFYMKSVMTGIGGVGGRATFHMTTNVALGSWSNALKGLVEYGSSGSTSGLGSAVLGELSLSAGTSSGTYAPFEAQLVFGTGALPGSRTSFLHMEVTGNDKSKMDDSGYLFKIDGLSVNSGKLFQENTASAATHAMRCDINGTSYYLMFTTSGA